MIPVVATENYSELEFQLSLYRLLTAPHAEPGTPVPEPLPALRLAISAPSAKS